MKIKQAYRRLHYLGSWLLLLLLASSRPAPGMAQTGSLELTRQVDKSYTFRPNQVLEIINQYGKVHVNTWDKAQVEVKIRIVSRGSKQQNVQNRLDEVEIRERSLGQKVQLETMIPEHNIVPQVARQLVDQGVNVSYEVYMPKDNPLEVENKFGDVYLSEREANVSVELSYGKLIAEKLAGPNNSLKLSFGDSDIAYFRGGDIDYAFGQRHYIRQADALNLKTNTSSVQIDQVGELNFLGKLGKVEINEAERVMGDFSSTLFSITLLKKSLNMSVKYAPGFQIDKVGPDFTSIRIESNFSPLELSFHPQSTFLLDAEIEFGSLNKGPLSNASLKERKTGNFSIYEGKVGPDPKPLSKVYIRGKYGNLKLSHWN